MKNKKPRKRSQDGFKKKRNCSSRRKQAHFEESQWNRASLRRLLRILESALKAIAGGARKSGLVLTFAVLETFASARLAVFFALTHARISSEEAIGLEGRTQVGVGHQQRPRDP